ncbi:MULTISPECIES: hypothetical protein [unclassified Pseudomonas]|uniref:hypothetical protein n=1 Tax=unclassified Pseudomonas TaxID=196821 RepID=UPI0015A1CB60|nr:MULTISPECIES: hypothetical protein [unclassified Pseudomonas]NWC92620.1 hypothetical protein [Pseudomonas sp. IPO3779]NWD15617.1 hypothetical protein [Pseudomonas sp. IPO3778]
MARPKGQEGKVRGIKFPTEVLEWLESGAQQAVRSFTGEVLYKLKKLKEIEDAGEKASA